MDGREQQSIYSINDLMRTYRYFCGKICRLGKYLKPTSVLTVKHLPKTPVSLEEGSGVQYEVVDGLP